MDLNNLSLPEKGLVFVHAASLLSSLLLYVPPHVAGQEPQRLALAKPVGRHLGRILKVTGANILF